MELCSDPEQEIVSTVDGSAVTLGDVFSFDQLGRTHYAVAEITNPLHILVITQAAAAVLHIGLLHENRTAILAVAFFLVVQTPLKIAVDLATHAVFKEISAELGVDPPVPSQIA